MKTTPRLASPTPAFGAAYGCLLVLGLPFAAVATVLLVSATQSVWRAIEVSSWVEVPAVISAATLDASHDSDGAPVYKANVTYDYEFRGQRYSSSSISVEMVREPATEKQRYAELASYRERGVSFRCYVNEERPEEAVLYRTARLEMLSFVLGTGLLCGGVGYSLMIIGFIMSLSSRRQKRLMRQYPDSPWFHRIDWKNRRVKGNSGASMRTALIVAGIATLFALPLVALLVYQDAPTSSRAASGVSLAIILVSAVAIIRAIRMTLRWRRFGGVVLSISTLPTVPGQSLRGTLAFPFTFGSDAAVSLVLECTRVLTQSQGQGTTVSSASEWRKEIAAKAQRGVRGGSVVAVDIPIPEGLPSAGMVSDEEYVQWKLAVVAKAPGDSMELEYDIPVFGPTISEPADDEDEWDGEEGDEDLDALEDDEGKER